ncbi:hypothetical protein Sru01_22610 [Sphaerisporangium rufum]|uniref:Endonuclease/exonuclease/phosphatase domain-containing protein n=1 Tax=Sphaerisporangium rufum TaxID=1381558 RepID=A0A919UYZ9_9ACTN|nr:ExeM/NucH family extracellular endonuclease [Sphaerisporangium rufum]GII77279.1 hypothetical protein Sru01_22610 [Sphaerisporangium rufum]
MRPLTRAVAALAAAGTAMAGLAVIPASPAAAAPGTVQTARLGDPGPAPSGTPAPTPAAGPCEVPATAEIAEVQGAGETSPLAGRQVRVQGVVTGDFQGANGLGGFTVQDPDPDGDPATSDAVFVYSSRPVAAGDLVRVSGTVTEYNGLTELTSVTAADVCGTGTVEPAAVTLPWAEGTGLERLEGVLVRFATLTVSEVYDLARYGELTLSAGGRLYQPTDRAGVDPARDARRRVLLDDASTVQNPPALPYHTTGSSSVRVGDTTRGLTGVLTYGFGAYRLQPTRPVVIDPANPRPPRPRRVGGDVRVASLNTLNWFTTLGSRGATTAQERDRQLAKLVATLKGLDPDVAGLMEVENNGTGALDALVAALNAEAGAGTYRGIVSPNPGTDAIQVALIYKPAAVTPAGPARSSADPVFRRPPLIQEFRRARGGAGSAFTMIVNHFKSKGCDGATGADLDQGDGQGCFNDERVRQARAVLDLIATARPRNPLVLGDLNAYGEEDPVHALEKGGLTSVSKEFVRARDRYSYVFGGLSGELDHMLAARSLMKRVTGATIWHVNADEGRFLDYNTEFNPPALYAPDPFRSSDHDPLLLGLDLPGH